MEDELDPKEPNLSEDEDTEADLDELTPGKKKPKKAEIEDDSIEALAEDEAEVLPEDSFDDVDLW